MIEKLLLMNDKDLHALILGYKVALALLILAPIVALVVYVFHQKSKRTRMREAILREHRQIIGNQTWFPVRYASEVRFYSSLKIFPWEGAGILVMFPGSVRFFGQTLSGEPLALQFAPDNSIVKWVGRASLANGSTSWFYFATVFEKHFFSSETGVAVFGSHKSTRAIYDTANGIFQAQSPS